MASDDQAAANFQDALSSVQELSSRILASTRECKGRPIEAMTTPQESDSYDLQPNIRGRADATFQVPAKARDCFHKNTEKLLAEDEFRFCHRSGINAVFCFGYPDKVEDAVVRTTQLKLSETGTFLSQKLDVGCSAKLAEVEVRFGSTQPDPRPTSNSYHNDEVKWNRAYSLRMPISVSTRSTSDSFQELQDCTAAVVREFALPDACSLNNVSLGITGERTFHTWSVSLDCTLRP